MRIGLYTLVLVGLVAGPLRAEETGRAAVVHLADGKQIKCVVLGYADGRFKIEEGGQQRVLEIRAVQKVVFGDAVGEHIRGPLDPPAKVEPTTAPAGLEPGEGGRRPMDHLARIPEARRVIGFLWMTTEGFSNLGRVQKIESDIQAKLAGPKGPGEENAGRNMRLSLAVLRVVQDDAKGAQEILDALQKEFPADPALKGLTAASLGEVVAKWKKSEGFRPPRRFGPRDKTGRPPGDDRGWPPGPSGPDDRTKAPPPPDAPPKPPAPDDRGKIPPPPESPPK